MQEEGDVGGRERAYHPKGAAKDAPPGVSLPGVLSEVGVTALSLLITESFYRFTFQEKNSGVPTGFSRPW